MLYICENCYEEYDDHALCCDEPVTPMFLDYQELNFEDGELHAEELPQEPPV